ncbi:MAG TPA: DUF29 family protein [Acetobacteraceae bacterium]|nr:DUF29 family protein [Acetobacteraceae bacterium]
MSDYDLDIYAWSRRQGALLRRLAAGERVNDADLDWPNIAEEIETVGRSERAAVRSHVLNVLEHLIKLHQAAGVTSDGTTGGLAGHGRAGPHRNRTTAGGQS